MPGNQTLDEWLSVTSEEDMGTGLFIAAPGGDKQFVKEVLYLEFVRRAEDQKYFAYKWVPWVIAAQNSVIESKCSRRCATTCVKPGCICDQSVGRCK